MILHGFINFNGAVTARDLPLIGVLNRGLRFGDGVFETMCWEGGRIKNLDLHLARLFQGLQLLKFDLTGFSPEYIAVVI